jgi:outer membrane protein OmpA-like peptidoglycan-associated protein
MRQNASASKDEKLSKTQTGAIIGGILGAIIGASTKGDSKVKRAAIGGAIGAAIGGGVGYGLEQQAKEVAKELDTTVNNDPNALLDPSKDIVVSHTKEYIKVTFKDEMMFKTNSDIPTINASNKIDKVTNVLRKYPHMIVQVVGHTDSKGSYEYNQKLSHNRAKNVGNRLYNNGVENSIFSKGCAYQKPIVANKTHKDRALNRRVEIYLYPNEQSVINPCIQG